MYIDCIEIKNYKGFTNETVKFHSNLNVFIGSNASGKTSLMTALLKTIYNITIHFSTPELHNPLLSLSDDDITYDSKVCHLKSVIKEFPKYNDEIISFISKVQPGAVLDIDAQPYVNNQKKFIDWYRIQVSTNFQTVPIFKFYPANRGSLEYQNFDSNRSYQISQLETWSNIYQTSISYSKFFRWFFDYETNELRLQRDANDFSIEIAELKGVRIALTKAFKMLNYGDVEVYTRQIKRQGNSKLSPTLVIKNLTSKKIDDIEQKSDGEKSIISLVADIAYNMSLAKDFSMENDSFLNSPGVIIIDEIESHLHPSWQREIVPILENLFPNIQFFIATHSPQVVSAVNSENIFICQDFKVEQINLKTKGEDTNTLLKYIFNSTERPKEYVNLIEQFYNLIENKSDPMEIENLINKINKKEAEDKAQDINVLVDELKLQLEAYKFDKEHEANS